MRGVNIPLQHDWVASVSSCVLLSTKLGMVPTIISHLACFIVVHPGFPPSWKGSFSCRCKGFRALPFLMPVFSESPFRRCAGYGEKITTSGGPASKGVTDLSDGFEGTTEAAAIMYHAPTTPEIAHDASAADMEELLETLPSLGQVCVTLKLVVLTDSVEHIHEDNCLLALDAHPPALTIPVQRTGP